MSEDPLFEEDQWPEWLNWIASRVDELVASKHGMDRFRRMLREWKTERDAQGPSTMVDRRGHIRHDPVVPLPVRRLSLSEKYALLAAIHDVICCDAAPSRYRTPKRIDPWQMHKSIKRIGLAKATAGASYMMLCHRVSELADGHRHRVESALGDVIDDLGSAAKTPQADSPGVKEQRPHVTTTSPTEPKPKPKRRGREPDTDPKADKRIAEAWGTGRHKTYADLAHELGRPPLDVRRAIDRHRHRSRKRKSGRKPGSR